MKYEVFKDCVNNMARKSVGISVRFSNSAGKYVAVCSNGMRFSADKLSVRISVKVNRVQ